VALIGRVSPCGQVAVPAASSMVKSAKLNPGPAAPATTAALVRRRGQLLSSQRVRREPQQLH
jgi:hypothetical protein